MIRFLLTRGFDFTFKPVKEARERPSLSVAHYDDILHAQWLRPATYVFTDLDRLSYWDLEQAGKLFVRLKDAGFPVLNNPAKVKKRYALLRALHAAGLNDFNTYRVDELPGTMRFPVFLRKEQGHGAPLSDLLHTRQELLDAVDRAVDAGIPPDVLMVVEYAGEPVREGQYRKMAAFRIGNEIVPHFSVNDHQWLVKDGVKDPTIEDLYQEEREMLATNPYAGHLQKVFDVAQIDYGRADFSFYKGRLQVFEINTNPTIPPPFHRHPSMTRRENTQVALEKYLKALYAIDSKSGKPVHFPPVPMDRAATARETHRRKVRARQMEHDKRLGIVGYSQRVKYFIGNTLDFSDKGAAALHMREGWGNAESWGTWTQGRHAVLKILFPQAPACDLHLNAQVRSLAHPSQPAVRAEVHVNGEMLADWVLQDGEFADLHLTVPARALHSEECEIAFKILNPRSPKSLGLSDDGRLLGLGFRALDFQWP